MSSQRNMSASRAVAQHSILAMTLLASGVALATIAAAGQTADTKEESANSQTASPSAEPPAKTATTMPAPADDEWIDACENLAEIQSEIELMQRAVQHSVMDQSGVSALFPQPIEMPAVTPGWPRFGKPADMPKEFRWPSFPKSHVKESIVRRAWQQHAASSWSQQGSRFRYEQPVRGVIVRLEGHMLPGSLAVEQIKVAPSGNSNWSTFTTVSQCPNPTRTRSKKHGEQALEYVEKPSQ